MLTVVLLFSCNGKPAAKKLPEAKDTTIVLHWKEAAPGIDFCETDAPLKSNVNDSRLTVLRIDPDKVEFELLCGTALDKQPHTVKEWAERYDFDIVFNAGMYELVNKMKSRAYMQTGKHVNNGELEPEFNSMFVFHPIDTSRPSVDIVDLECSPWEQVKPNFGSFAQGLRMIDCNGSPLEWKSKQSCSMLLAAKDPEGKLVLVFTRSPYFHNDMIRFLGMFPMKLTHAIYLEGGPETSLYVHVGTTRLNKIGSWVSDTYENDANDHFWKLPNVIGVRLK